ncbi:MAG: hypothetical protein ACM3OC_06645 [Deltaproteobacteria bacterium]
MNDPLILQVGVVLVVFLCLAILVVILHIFQDPARKFFKALALKYKGKAGLLADSMRGKFRDIDFSVHMAGGGKSSPALLVFRLCRPASFMLRVYKQGARGPLGEISIVRQARINDPFFDSQFIIYSDRPMMAVNFLNPSAKNTLKELFAQGFESFLMNKQGLWLGKPAGPLEQDLGPEKVEWALNKLLSLSGGVA